LIADGTRGVVLCDEPMALHTSLKVGGPADAFCMPEDMDDLKLLLAVLAEEKLPYLVVGGGYNLLVKDGGIRGAVISLEKLNAVEELPGSLIRSEAGVENAGLVRFAQDCSLTGLEFLIGIPGRFGGALAMNAGAHGKSLLERVTELTTVTAGVITVRSRDELRYGYRFLELSPEEVIIAATMQLAPASLAETKERIETFMAHRRAAQRIGYPNAGSFFKNPPEMEAWRLIDAAGLRGYRVGGAQVSEVHANFLVNIGGATASDFLMLARLIKEKVLESSGVELQEEVRIVGED